MGNNQSVHLSIKAEALAAATKEQINRKVDDYIQFIKNTSVEIDLDIEDLANEMAVITTAFKESSDMKAVTPSEYEHLTADVESYVNAQKHSIRRLFAHLEEAGEIFEDMATSICYDSDEDDTDEDGEDGDEEGGDDDDEDDSIHDSEVESSEEDAQGLPYVTSEGDEGGDEDEVDEDEDEDEDGSDGDDSEGSDSSYDSFEEEVGDEDVLHYCRFAANDSAAAYEKEMREINLPESLLSQRLSMLNHMMYEAAECSVAGAVQELVENVRLAALDDIDNILCLGMAQDVFSSNDGSLIREVLREIIATGAIARQALEDLPFSRREEIENAKDDIVNAVEGQIRDVQLKVSDKAEVLEHLMDLDIDEYGDDYLDEALADIDDEEEEEEEEQPRVQEIEEPKPVKGKSKAEKKEPASKKEAAPKPSPKKVAAPEPSPKEEVVQDQEVAKTKGSKRKSVEPAVETKARATRARK